jgi:hypothetical protein
MSILAKHFVVRNSTLARALALFTAAGAVSAILASAGTAAAARALVPATACSYETDFVTDYKVVGNIGIGNQSGGTGPRARNLYCPMPDSASNPRSTVTQLWVSGYDANNDPPAPTNLPVDGRVLAQVCGHDDWAGGFFCSSWAEATTFTQSGIQYDTNIGALTASTDPLPMFKNPAYANWYTNLVVALPRPGIYGATWLYGFSTN